MATWVVAIEVAPESVTELELAQVIGPAAAMGLGLTDLVVAEATVWEAVTFPAVEEETEMLSEAARGVTTDPVLAPAAAAAHRVRAVAGEAAEVEAEVEAVVVADVAGEHYLFNGEINRSWQ